MAKSSKGKSPKGRKPLFYVDNPNASELKWLEELKKKTPATDRSSEKRTVQVNAASQVLETPVNPTANSAQVRQPDADAFAQEAIPAVPSFDG